MKINLTSKLLITSKLLFLIIESYRQSTKVALIAAHCSGVPSNTNERTMPMNQDNNQLANSIEIKQEADIKQEPVTVAELVDISASTYRNATHISGFNERDGEYDFDFISSGELKVEEKEEYVDKKEEEPKINTDSGEETANNHSDWPIHDGVSFVVVPERNGICKDSIRKTRRINMKPFAKFVVMNVTCARNGLDQGKEIWWITCVYTAATIPSNARNASNNSQSKAISINT